MGSRLERVAHRRRRRRQQMLLGFGLVLLVTVGALAFATRVAPNESAGAVDTRRSTSTSAPPTTTTQPVVSGGYSRLVREENARPGTAAWRLSSLGAPADIEGFADATSVRRGELVTLRVSTVAPSFTVEAYRMGWYQGLGARLVWTSPPVPGRVQAGPTWSEETGTSEARWEPSLEVPILDGWMPGSYLLKLVASTGQQRWVPLTVRDDASTAAYVVMNAVTTWQAYNRWGGCSLYHCSGRGSGRGSDRATVVSFDRPYDAVTGGSGDFVGNELPLIMRVEELGLDVTYLTSVDLHQRPELLARHRALVSLGHDEYWSKQMRDGAERARDAGVNLMFLGANAVYRQIRLEPSPGGADRRVVNYRSGADPVRRVDPSQTTVSFRESPVNRPEATLIGQQYECNPVRADLVVTDPGAWVWAGTGVTAGQHLEIVVGSEYDRFRPGDGGPRNVQVLAHSPVRCRGKASYSDVTYYTAPSGAGVFATGTNYWVSKLTPPAFTESPYNPVIVTATQNVLLAFGEGPAGAAHPSAANWQGLPGL